MVAPEEVKEIYEEAVKDLVFFPQDQKADFASAKPAADVNKAYEFVLNSINS